MMLFKPVFIVAAVFLAKSYSFSYDYTVYMTPGRRECFYQPIIETNTKVEFEYQVLDMTPINYQIKSPRGVSLHSDMRKPHNVLELTLTEPGIYEICVLHRYDNNPKQVYLSLFSESEDKHWPFVHNEELDEKKDEAEQYMEMAVDSFKEYMANVNKAVEKMRFLQQSIRSYNIKDYVLQKGNASRVANFSAVQLAIMVITGIVQVVTIRRLFGTNVTEVRNMKMST